MRGESVPQLWGYRGEIPVTHSMKVSPGLLVKVGVCGAGVWLLDEQFFEVQRAIFVFCLKGDRQPMECMEEWFCWVESAFSQQDPSSRDLYMPEPSKAAL